MYAYDHEAFMLVDELVDSASSARDEDDLEKLITIIQRLRKKVHETVDLLKDPLASTEWRETLEGLRSETGDLSGSATSSLIEVMYQFIRRLDVTLEQARSVSKELDTLERALKAFRPFYTLDKRVGIAIDVSDRITDACKELAERLRDSFSTSGGE